MLKAAGAIMIIISATIFGFIKSEQLKIRKESLSKIIYSLRIMENEISYGKNSMDEIMKKTERLNGIKFSKAQCESARERYLEAIKKKELCLLSSDIDALKGFCDTLGTTDSSVQLKNIKNTIKTLEMLEGEAKNNFTKYGKMYKSVGMLAGIMAVIILL